MAMWSPWVERPEKQTGWGSGALGRGRGGIASLGYVSAAGAPRVGELTQESRWKGRVPVLGNKHV